MCECIITVSILGIMHVCMYVVLLGVSLAICMCECLHSRGYSCQDVCVCVTDLSVYVIVVYISIIGIV